MILAAVFLISAIAFGCTLIAATKLYRDAITIAAAGIVGGLAAATFASFLVNLVLPIKLALLLATILLITGTIYLVKRYRINPRPLLAATDRLALIVAIMLIIILIPVSHKTINTQSDGALATNIINNYGDIAWHTAIATGFVTDHAALPNNPIFAGKNLVYPFLTDFLSSLLLSDQWSLSSSFVIPAGIVLPTLFMLIYLVTRQLTNSRPAAIIALLLFLFAGSTLGWTGVFTDGISFIERFSTPAGAFTGNTDPASGYHLLSPLISLILPQRSLLFGISLALVILLILTKPSLPVKKQRVAYCLAGSLAGLLPLFHAHVTLALVPAIIGLIVINPRAPWHYFIVPAGLIGLPQVSYYLTAETSGFSLAWHPGWIKPAGISFLAYWFKNSGFLIPITIAGFFLKVPRTLKALAAAGLLLWLFGNLWLIARWDWDNTKIFIAWLLFTVPLAAAALAYAMKRSLHLIQIAVSLVIVFQITSGALDITQLLLNKESYRVWNADQRQLADLINQQVPASATIITAPTHNSGIELTGHARYLGYTGHVWSHGINPTQRQQQLIDYYTGRVSELPDLQPNYILVGPAERRYYSNLIIRETWQPVVTAGPYTLYQII